MAINPSIYPTTISFLSSPIPDSVDNSQLGPFLQEHPELYRAAPFLAELAGLEYCRYQIALEEHAPLTVEQRTINPRLDLLELAWKDLPKLLYDKSCAVIEEKEDVLIWYHPVKKMVVCRKATDRDLLALKIVSEGLDTRKVSALTGLNISEVDNILYAAEAQGLIFAPPSRIVRGDDFPRGEVDNEDFFSAPTFTLQWHITQKCDLHCRHCYDRSERSPMSLEQGVDVLDQLYDFCRDHNVFTQVSFSGGNPLLYPYFTELYKEAADRGFLTAILGNPMPAKTLEPILAVQKPVFYQISLEGMEKHNDYIRGKGHFQRALDFLETLKGLKVFSMVMLTLTRDNQNQVLELAELLRDRVDLFTFNRLAMVGEGAALASAPIEGFRDFLKQYSKAAEGNPSMRLKDNLFNLLRHQQAEQLMGGCAGRGCGAAFNFVSLLPDGEVHACRKLPSCLGNIYQTPLAEIYHSDLAKRYRMGSDSCRDCAVRPVCGGCPAVSYGFGLDIFTERDPYCFKDC